MVTRAETNVNSKMVKDPSTSTTKKWPGSGYRSMGAVVKLCFSWRKVACAGSVHCSHLALGGGVAHGLFFDEYLL